MLQAKQVEEEYKKLLKSKDRPIKENALLPSHLKWSKAVNDLRLEEGCYLLQRSMACGIAVERR